tara:strand:- start:2833 stop:5439 length:2607 start_codon:yes stop_codon:yes gene_type:complete
MHLKVFILKELKIMPQFNISSEERNRIRGLHITESKDKRITSVLNEAKALEGWFGKMFGGKKRKEDIYNILKAGVQIGSPPLYLEDRKENPPYYTEEEIKRFANFMNKLDRVFVNEKKVIELLRTGVGLGLEELDILTRILYASSTDPEKPQNFTDVLVASGAFNERESYNLDRILDTNLSDLMKKTKKQDIKKRDCIDTNPFDKENEPREWAWCDNKLNPEGDVQETEDSYDYQLSEVNRIREIMGLKILTEQKVGSVIMVDGREMEVVDYIKQELPPINVGQQFGSGLYNVSGKVKKSLDGLVNKMKNFFNRKEVQGIVFDVDLEGGASLVPISDALARKYGISTSLSDADRNKWLAGKRASEVKKYLEAQLGQLGNVQIPEPKVTLGTTKWDKNKGVNHKDYTEEQFMNITVKAAGKRQVLEALPAFCEKGFEPEQGGLGDPKRAYKVYKGRGKKLNLGAGEGKICLSFDALTVPDMFELTYNGKTYRSMNSKTGKAGFISGKYDEISEEELDKFTAMLPEIQDEIAKLTGDIQLAQDALESVGPEQEAKLEEILLKQQEELEKSIEDTNRKMKKYGYNLSIPVKNHRSRKKWDDYIMHYGDPNTGYPNAVTPNWYWEEGQYTIDDTPFAGPGSDKRPEEFFNMADEGEVNGEWFNRFFNKYRYDNSKKIKRSTGFKTLWANRPTNKDWKKDDVAAFFLGMRRLEKQLFRNQDAKRDELAKSIKKMKRDYENRIENLSSNIEKETRRLQNELNKNIKTLNDSKGEAELSKKMTEYKLRTGTKGMYKFDELLKEILADSYGGRKNVPDIIGPKGTITFDKVLGKNEAYLQVIAPIGGTLWAVQVGCGDKCKGLVDNPVTYDRGTQA